ncbi:hypothetical protein ACN9MC_04765 [Ensifer adhaerens]|uniref:hypothetical protein n=1 Tax=Ensifer adhaerens TaxID=106592 RepID=UPI003CEAEB4E
MVANTRLTRTDSLEQLLGEVTNELVMTGIDSGDGVIALPQQYPGGAPVVVRIRRDAGVFIVSDHGAGYTEAEHLGAPQTFTRLAPRIATDHGVRYDGNMMFAMEVPRDWLANAIIFVASASRRAVEATAEALAEERNSRDKLVLKDLVRAAFRDKAAFDVEYRGRSTKQWKFTAMVRQSDHWSLFDLVSPHHVSINSAIVKFQDIVRLDDAPRGIAVLSNREKMDAADISLVGEAASRVIPLSIEVDDIREAA